MKIYSSIHGSRIAFCGNRGRFAAKVIDKVGTAFRLSKYIGRGTILEYAMSETAPIETIDWMTFAKLAHELSTVYRFTSREIEYVSNFFGVETIANVGMTVRYPDNMQKTRVAKVLNAFARAKKIVTDKGFGKVFDDGTIVFGKEKATARGTYARGSNEIRISDAIASDEDLMVAVIVHELGHKIEMSNFEVMKISNSIFLNSEKIFILPEIGERISSEGAKAKYALAPDYTIVKRDILKGTIVVKNGSVELSGTVSSFCANGFKFSNSNHYTHTVEIKSDIMVGSIFPSQYATVDAREMFAECFTAYILGKTAGNSKIDNYINDAKRIYERN